MKKGFISMSIIYTFLISFILLLLLFLSLYAQKSRLVDSITSEAQTQLDDYYTNNEFKSELAEPTDGINIVFPYHIIASENLSLFVVPVTGIYRIELWGAGGKDITAGGGGSYTAGNILLNKNDRLYFKVGIREEIQSKRYAATDVRYFGVDYIPTTDELNWNSELGLNSRIMVAASGTTETGKHGGGLNGYAGNGKFGKYSCDGYYWSTTGAVGGATQIAGGAKSYLQISDNNGYSWESYYSSSGSGVFAIGGSGAVAGGGGYYGGAGAFYPPCKDAIPGTGSSFISGHAGCVAISSSTSRAVKTSIDNKNCTIAISTMDVTCSYHYTGKIFTNTKMIDGATYEWVAGSATAGAKVLMPSPNGVTYPASVGQYDDGHAKISLIQINE